jgi:transposase
MASNYCLKRTLDWHKKLSTQSGIKAEKEVNFMALRRRVFTRDFKLGIIREIEAGKSQAAVAREHQVTANTISKWRRQYRKYKDRAFAGNGNGYTDEARICALERMVGRLTMENDFLKKVLASLEEQAR